MFVRPTDLVDKDVVLELFDEFRADCIEQISDSSAYCVARSMSLRQKHSSLK